MRFLGFGKLALVIGLVSSVGARAGNGRDEIEEHFHRSPEDMKKDCEKLRKSILILDRNHTQEIYNCYVVYYFTGDDGFATSIYWGKRYLAQWPDEWDISSHVASMEIWRYMPSIEGKIKELQWPGGEKGLRTALSMFDHAEKIKSVRENPKFYLDAAAVLLTPARYYVIPEKKFKIDEDLQNRIIRYSLAAEKLLAAKDDRSYDRLRARMNVGDAYRRLGKYDLAAEWFKKALEISPEYHQAQTYLEEVASK